MPRSKVRKKKKGNAQKSLPRIRIASVIRNSRDHQVEFEAPSKFQESEEYRKLLFVSERFHEVCKEYFAALNGSCYMQGYCLAEVLKRNGYKARSVTGKLALLIKNTNKYAMYGRMGKRGVVIGNYHTWCEVEIDGINVIVDTSTQDNISFLELFVGIKVDQRIGNIIISEGRSTFLFKYQEEEKLIDQSLSFLNRIDNSLLEKVINETCVRVYS